MEEIPTPPLETYDQRTVFEIIRKMMAKAPDERFQSADDLVQVLEAGGGMAASGSRPPPPKPFRPWRESGWRPRSPHRCRASPASPGRATTTDARSPPGSRSG